jgi:hypothetical protein
MAAFLRKIGEVIVYAIMLALVAVCFTGKGLFIYEGF